MPELWGGVLEWNVQPVGESGREVSPPRSVAVVLCWSVVVAGCLVMGGLGMGSAGVAGVVGVVVAGVVGCVVTAGVFWPWWRALAVVSWVWAAGCVAGVLGLPVISVVFLSRSSEGGFRWTGAGSAVGVAVAVLLVLLVQLGASLRLYFWAREHHRLPARHVCPSCGYDLRATPLPSGPLLERCPECGWIR